MLCSLFWMSYARPMKIVKSRDRIEKKKLLTNKSGLFRSKKYTRMSEPITKNTPLMTAILKIHGHNGAKKRRTFMGRC